MLQKKSILIIAVDEWALRMDKPQAWLSAYRTISIIAPAEEVYQRRNHLTETPIEVYSRFNFSEARKRIYSGCNIVLDMGGLTQDEAAGKLKQALDSGQMQTL